MSNNAIHSDNDGRRKRRQTTPTLTPTLTCRREFKEVKYVCECDREAYRHGWFERRMRKNNNVDNQQRSRPSRFTIRYDTIYVWCMYICKRRQIHGAHCKCSGVVVAALLLLYFVFISLSRARLLFLSLSLVEAVSCCSTTQFQILFSISHALANFFLSFFCLLNSRSPYRSFVLSFVFPTAPRLFTLLCFAFYLPRCSRDIRFCVRWFVALTEIIRRSFESK